MPLLEELLEEHHADANRVWLDLGPAHDGLIARLRPRRACVLVADLPAARAAQRPEWYRPDRLLPARHWARAVNRVLVWNLFDYLEPDQLGELAAQLAHHAAPGCKVHALIHYAAPEMPEEPPLWRLHAGGGFNDRRPAGSLRAAPRHSPKALEKAMPEWRVERMVLLTNGMQEFVLAVRR